MKKSNISGTTFPDGSTGKARMMRPLLIADKDAGSREQMKRLFSSDGYRVKTAQSVVGVLRDILRNNTQVLLLGIEFDNMLAAELIPLLKKCKPELMIILVSDENSLPLLRMVRREGIFYHALKPVEPEDQEELRLAVKCAFSRRPSEQTSVPRWLQHAEVMA